MRILLDTQLLIWALGAPERLSPRARAAIEDPALVKVFSTASVWEVAIKQSLRRPAFHLDAGTFHRTLLDDGFVALPVSGEHAAAVSDLPWIHRDPFDRILLAQAIVEGMTLLTADRILSRYPGPVQAM